MGRHPHRFVRSAAEEQAREPLGFMSLKEVARHFGVSETTIRRSSHEFAGLRRQRIGGRLLIVREDVMNLSRRLEREAMCAEEECVTEREERRAKNEHYRAAAKLRE